MGAGSNVLPVPILWSTCLEELIAQRLGGVTCQGQGDGRTGRWGSPVVSLSNWWATAHSSSGTRAECGPAGIMRSLVGIAPYVLAYLVQVLEQAGVEHIFPVGAVKALHQSVLHGATRLDEGKFNAPASCPFRHVASDELRTVVHPDLLGSAHATRSIVPARGSHTRPGWMCRS